MAILGRSVSKCSNAIKYILFTVNFILCVGGLLAFACSIWIIVSESFANELVGTNLYGGTSWIMMITGIFVVVLSGVGCLGSVKEIRFLLFAYMLFMSFIFATMFTGGIIAFVFREKAQQTIRNGMTSSLRAYGNYLPVTTAWDETQQRLKCCGIESYRDWRGYVPESCCKPAHHGRLQKCNNIEQLNDHVAYMNGCLNATKEYVNEKAMIIGTICTVVALIIVLGIILSFSLFRMLG